MRVLRSSRPKATFELPSFVPDYNEAEIRAQISLAAAARIRLNHARTCGTSPKSLLTEVGAKGPQGYVPAGVVRYPFGDREWEFQVWVRG